MDKNTIIGFLLIAAVLFGFQWWSQPSAEEMAEAARQDSIAQVEKAQAEKAAALKAEQKKAREQAEKAADSTSIFCAHKTGTEQKVVLQNDSVAITLSTLGGVPQKAVLYGYNNQEQQDVVLFDEEVAHLQLALDAKSENILTDELYFEAVDQTETSVTMQLTALNGGTLCIDYNLHPGSYMLDMVVRAEGLSSYFSPKTKSLSIDWSDRLRQQEKGFKFENRYSCMIYKKTDGGTKEMSQTGKKEKDVEDALDWVACKNQFFSTVLIAHQDFTGAHLSTEANDDKTAGYLKDLSAQMETSFDPSGKQPTQMQLYVGPNNFHTLKSTNKLGLTDKNLELEELVDFGWPLLRWINRWVILYLFDGLRGLGLSMGIVLLLLTLIVKAAVYPATRKSYLSSARMRVLKPKVDELNAKYPRQEDAMKKQQEMMQLYSSYGVSPMGGCLPMLIQMPIFLALFVFVPNAIELRGQSFLWANDLSAYDDIIRWGKDIWLIGDHISIFCLLFTLTNLGNTLISMRQQQNSMMSDQQAQQMKTMQYMMMFMPVAFFFMFNDYSSGLCYYYFLSGLISILMMWGLRRFTDDKKLLAQLEDYKARHANDPKKASGMQARFEAMQKMVEEQQRRQQNKG